MLFGRDSSQYAPRWSESRPDTGTLVCSKFDGTPLPATWIQIGWIWRIDGPNGIQSHALGFGMPPALSNIV